MTTLVADRNKIKKALTEALKDEEALCTYLKTYPRKVHICGDKNKCVIADFIVDEYLPVNAVASVGDGVGIEVYFDSKLVLDPDDPDGEFLIVHEDAKLKTIKEEYTDWMGHKVQDSHREWDEGKGKVNHISFTVPEWADRVIQDFDQLERAYRQDPKKLNKRGEVKVTSKEVLNEGIVCSAE